MKTRIMIPTQVTFANVLQKFTGNFLPRVNVTFERHLLSVRDQAEGESANRYVRHSASLPGRVISVCSVIL